MSVYLTLFPPKHRARAHRCPVCFVYDHSQHPSWRKSAPHKWKGKQ